MVAKGRAFTMGLPPKGSMAWQSEAACQYDDTRLFAEAGKRQTPAARRRVASAMAICAGCPVRAECLEFGISNRSSGVYGGQHLMRGVLTPLHTRQLAA